MIRTATLSGCETYRYHLRRNWSGHAVTPSLLWVMLNPSTANESIDDPTIRKCHGFTERLGFRALEVVNLFAFRATDPCELRAAWSNGVDVVGDENDAHIQLAMNETDRIIFAWGAFSAAGVPGRARMVANLARQAGKTPSCLGTAKDGQPRHPLMLGYSTSLVPWRAP